MRPPRFHPSSARDLPRGSPPTDLRVGCPPAYRRATTPGSANRSGVNVRAAP